MTTLQNHPT
ncbi:hypothetical protein BDFB_009606 [Asbolus verrucosus]|uniref:Uncharacterized protein n=1 Tax=Asbolus verrucosus TaxID=1661398 RepID=A0A482VR25_ASBVE|nr:hypothetical protein BDFB_009606 [Asbolus verrucosus]